MPQRACVPGTTGPVRTPPSSTPLGQCPMTAPVRQAGWPRLASRGWGSGLHDLLHPTGGLLGLALGDMCFIVLIRRSINQKLRIELFCVRPCDPC